MTRPTRRERRRRESAPAEASAPARAAPFNERIAAVVGRYAIWIAVGLAVTHVALALLTLMPFPHTGGDNAAYISLARSLLDGSYDSVWAPGSPAHTQYPPVFPAMLALAMLVGIKPWVGLKLVVVACSAAAVAFSFLWVVRSGRPLVALASGALLALSPGVLEQGRWILSDVPFWLFTMVALWAFHTSDAVDRRLAAAGVAAIVLAYFTRSAGLPLAVAAVAWLALRRRWKTLLLLVAILGPLAAAWIVRSSGADDGYVTQFLLIDPYAPDDGRIGAGELWERIKENFEAYREEYLPRLLFGRATDALVVAGSILGGLAILGWLRTLRRPPLAALLLPAYAGLMLVWPAVWAGERFLLPVLPVLLFFAGSAVSWLARFADRRAPVIAGAVATLALLAPLRTAIAQDVEVARLCQAEARAGRVFSCLPGEWNEFFAVAEWARTALPADAVVLSRKPRLFHYFSGRRGDIYPLREDPAALLEEAEAIGARWVVFDALGGLARVYVVPALLRKPDAFCIARAPMPYGTAVFGILENALSIPDRPLAEGDVGFAACGEELFGASGGSGS